MIIAKHGKYKLEHQKFLGRKHRSTHTIEITKDINGSMFTVCTLHDGNLQSVSDRLISSIDTFEDVESLKILTRLLYNIYETEEIDIE